MSDEKNQFQQDLIDIKNRTKNVEENQIRNNVELKRILEDVREIKGGILKVGLILITGVISGIITLTVKIFGNGG